MFTLDCKNDILNNTCESLIKANRYGGYIRFDMPCCITSFMLFREPLKGMRRPIGYIIVEALAEHKREHSRKPDEFYDLIESCSWGPRLEIFARGSRRDWESWGDQAEEYETNWKTYPHNSSTDTDYVEAAE